ncbi:MAG: ABC transporter permease subunit [Phycisphaerales bacterium]
MTGCLAIGRREILAAFATPLAWVLLAASGLLAAVVFASVGFRDGEIANLRPVLVAMGWAVLLLAPAIAMRSFAEEKRQGTLEVLCTSPIGEGSIVLGKFLACVVVLAIVLLPAAVLAIPLELFGAPDFGELACGLLGLLLVGSMVASLGILASALSSSQVLAYLGAMFPWLALVVAVKLLPAWLGPASNAWLEPLDPLRRLDAFVIGLLDSANVAYFLAGSVLFLSLAALALSRGRRRRPAGLGRAGRLAHATLRIAAMAIVAASAVAIASAPAARIRFDLTRTRAYSLGEETRAMLASLPGEWTIDLLVVPEEGDRALLEQLDEVLRRFSEANERIEVGRLDPTDPADLAAYERLLESLAESHAAESREHEDAIDDGLAGLDELVAFANAKLPSVRAAAAAARARGGDGTAEQAAASMLEQVAATGPRLREEIENFLKTSASSPFPDLESARSTLVAHHRLRSDQLVEGLPRDGEAQRLAVRLRRSMDRLERLPPARLGEIAAAIGDGEAAVITGPDGAVVVPGWQLLPRSSFEGEETVRFDRRFRGEQLLTAAIRSLSIEAPPIVVFMHVEPASLLRRTPEGGDLAAIADELRAARFEVREWNAALGGEPRIEAGRGAVYVTIPPLRRAGVEPDERERALLAATRERIEAGDPVLLSLTPSVLPLLGGRDPWAQLALELGVEADTARTVLELAADESGRPSAQPLHLARDGEATHPLGAAIDGQAMLVFYPVPMSVREGATAILSLPPSDSRWIEEDWRRLREVEEVPEGKRQQEAVPMAAAVERVTADGRVQRAIVVGSSGWMLSNLADRTVELGGERVAFANPGNRELARSGIAWLAGLDAWVASGGSGREIARLSGISPETRTAWVALLLLGMPIVPLVAGGVVVWRRERGA